MAQEGLRVLGVAVAEHVAPPWPDDPAPPPAWLGVAVLPPLVMRAGVQATQRRVS